MDRRLIALVVSAAMAVVACRSNAEPSLESAGRPTALNLPYAPAGFDTKLLGVLACPENLSPLHLATRKELETIRSDVRAGRITLRNGASASASFDGLLIREDRRVAYPIRGQVAELRPEDGLALDPSVGEPHPEQFR